MWLVGAAALVCAVGAWVFTGLYARALQAYDTQRIGWHFLAATAAGASIWCTHFVAILAYRPRVPIEIDAGLTVASSLVAIAGATVAFIVAGRAQPRAAAALGGSRLGLSIAAMLRQVRGAAASHGCAPRRRVTAARHGGESRMRVGARRGLAAA